MNEIRGRYVHEAAKVEVDKKKEFSEIWRSKKTLEKIIRDLNVYITWLLCIVREDYTPLRAALEKNDRVEIKRAAPLLANVLKKGPSKHLLIQKDQLNNYIKLIADNNPLIAKNLATYNLTAENLLSFSYHKNQSSFNLTAYLDTITGLRATVEARMRELGVEPKRVTNNTPSVSLLEEEGEEK